ncbi:MAG: DUF2726 domain-containing protein [Robiginitomaculum sp.]|nr:DUF2726 domain-containing protein [Robiginitomaculum sp.]
MELIVIILICGLLVAGFFLRRPKWQDPKSTKADKAALFAYEARQSLFVNRSELALFAALNRYKRDGFHVMAKVRLEDILQVCGNLSDKRLRWQYRGRIKSRHVDFVLCDNAGRFLCAVELDGSSHKGDEAQMVDEFKDAIFKNAGILLVRINTGDDFGQFSRNVWKQFL